MNGKGFVPLIDDREPRALLSANRGYVQLRHSRDERSGVFCSTTAGWYYTVFWPFLPRDAYRDEAMRREVDAVYEDAGIDWPASSPSP